MQLNIIKIPMIKICYQDLNSFSSFSNDENEMLFSEEQMIITVVCYNILLL